MLSLYFLNCSANLPFTNPSNDLYTNAIPTAALYLDLAIKAVTAAKTLRVDNVMLAYDR
jgi:hypothetical protein